MLKRIKALFKREPTLDEAYISLVIPFERCPCGELIIEGERCLRCIEPKRKKRMRQIFFVDKRDYELW